MAKLITVSENLLPLIPLNFPNPPNYPSMELAKQGMAQVVVYQHKRPFIYQEQLLKVQEEAKQKKLGIWS